jgi:hypothetical protein
MNYSIIRIGIYGLIACMAFYAGKSIGGGYGSVFEEKQEGRVESAQVVVEDRTYEDVLYKKFSQMSEYCMMNEEEQTNTDIKLCAMEVSILTDQEIEGKMKSLVGIFPLYAEKVKNEDLEEYGTSMYEYIVDMPGYINDMHKSWLSYRESLCLAQEGLSFGGTGYSGFISSCEYQEGFRFLKILDDLESDWEGLLQ